MARFTNPNPTTVNPKLPNSVVHDMEVLNQSIGISLNLMTRIVLRETLANPARRDEIVAEIARERSCRRYGDSTAVYTWMNHETARAFAELMATTGARATMVARAIITVGCSGGLGRFRKRFIAPWNKNLDPSDDRDEPQRKRDWIKARDRAEYESFADAR